MDYMKIIERSFSNAWRYKFLWLFGFFVSIAEGFRGGFSWTDRLEHYDHLHRYWRFSRFDFEPALIAMILLAALFVWLILFLMSVLSEGALIRGISRKELGLETGFEDCWKTGWNKFLRLFGIVILAVIAVFSSIVILVIGNIPFWIVAKPLGLLVTLVSIPIFLAVILLIIVVEGWAIRFAVLYDENWLSSIAKGWRLFKNNIGKTLGVAFSSLLSQIIAWILLVICVIAVAIPFIILGIINLWIGLIPGIMVGFLIFILSSAIFGTFASSVWTIGFMKLTGFKGETGATVAEA